METEIITKKNRMSVFHSTILRTQRATKAIQSAQIKDRKQAISKAESESIEIERIVLELASSRVMLPHKEIGRLWYELDKLDDAILVAR